MPGLTRRAFAAGFSIIGAGSVFARQGGVALEAFAARQLPSRIFVPGIALCPGVFELRVYASQPHAMGCILQRHGIRAVLRTGASGAVAFLFRFESLEARQRAWDEFNADPEWHALHARAPVDVREISLYRLAS